MLGNRKGIRIRVDPEARIYMDTLIVLMMPAAPWGYPYRTSPTAPHGCGYLPAPVGCHFEVFTTAIFSQVKLFGILRETKARPPDAKPESKWWIEPCYIKTASRRPPAPGCA